MIRERALIQTPEYPQEAIVFSGKEYFDTLIEDINNANKSVELEVYIFSEDFVGTRVATALAQAQKRGAHVRLLIDGFGSPFWGHAIKRTLDSAGVAYQIFRPLPWNFWHWSKSNIRASTARKILYLFKMVNRRNHRKMCIIDRKIAWVGSLNISSHHLPISEGGRNWRDTAVRLANPYIDILQQAFEATWFRKSSLFTTLDPTKSSIRIFQTRKQRRLLRKDFLARLSNSTERIWITNAYFIPEISLLKCLKNASDRGVDVRIILPKHSDVFFLPWASAVFYRSLIKSNIKVFEYSPGMLHAKTLVIDDFFTVGSSNLNSRSFLHDLEVDIEIKSVSAKNQLATKFLEDLSHSSQITEKKLPFTQVFKRFLGKIFLVLQYWL